MSLMDLYDGFIFDYGQVLTHEPTKTEHGQMAGIIGVDPAEFEELYWRDRLQYDKGVLSGAEYWLEAGKKVGKVLTPDQISRLVELDSASWMHFDEPMWEFLRELRQAGKRVAVLSNMPRDLGEALKSQTSRFAEFDHVTLSYELGSVKPEAAIYEECLAGLKTRAKRTLFLDDRLANVRGAEMLGIDAIQFLNREQVLKQLRG